MTSASYRGFDDCHRAAVVNPIMWLGMLAALLLGTPATAATESECIRAASNPVEVAQGLQLYKELSQANLTKGEYERELEFVSRRDSAIEHLRNAPGGIFAISIRLPWQYATYDADKQTLTYDAFGDFVKFETNLLSPSYDLFDVLLLRSGSQRDGDYIGQNAFGAKVRVRSEIRTGFGIAYRREQPLIPNNGVSIPLSVDQAREARDSLELILVGRLEAPYTVELSASSNPTLEKPVDVAGRYVAIVVMPVCAVVRDHGTGRILLTRLR